MSNIAEIIEKHSIDLRTVDPVLNQEKNNYKRVLYWKDKPKYKLGDPLEGKQLIICNSNKFPEIDFDFLKQLPIEEGKAIKALFPDTLTFGRDGEGHSLYEVEDLPEDPEGTKQIEFNGGMLNEYRAEDCYSIFYGPLDQEANAEIKGTDITKIKYSKLKSIFNYSSLLAALCKMKPDTNGSMNNWLIPIVGELKGQGISQEKTEKIINKFLSIKGRTDRQKETEALIRNAYRKEVTSNIFSKNYPVPIDQASKFQFREIVKRLNPVKEKEKETTKNFKIKSYNIQEYKNLNIQKPKFLVDPLMKENSINFISGAKGKGKTEFTLGLTNSLARGRPFLNYEINEPHPIYFVDGEMDPYDILERNDVYINAWDMPTDPNYFKIVNYALQDGGVLPDLKEESFQNNIIDELELQKKLTGKNPIIILDNLRSLSGYEENNADDWLPIGKFLLKLRAKQFTSIVIDHHGKESKGPRGTSAKTDWANLSLLVSSERIKGDPNMRLNIKFDKARGLKPSQAEDYVAVYDLNGLWTSETLVDKQEQSDEDFCKKIHEWQQTHIEAEERWLKNLEKDLRNGKHDLESHKIIITNHTKAAKLTQAKIAEKFGISVGKVNRLMKEGGPLDQYVQKINEHAETLKESNPELSKHYRKTGSHY
jgi:hypothetical protein